MKTFSLVYSDDIALKHFIESHIEVSSKNILVQIFSGIIGKETILEVSSKVKQYLKDAHIIGATTAGEIFHGEMLEKQIVISFSIFETTSVSSAIVDLTQDHSFESVEKKLIKENTKVLIVFSDGLKSNAEHLLKQITQNNPNIIVSGGRAGVFLDPTTTYVFNDKKCLDNGFVIASLSGDDLIANNDYMLNWNTIGKEMIVTKSSGNIVYTIDNIEIKKLYEKYLGSEITKNLPCSVSEFPLIMYKNGIKIARTPINILEDGSMVFGANLHEGDRVRFSYGNIVENINSLNENYEKFKKFPSEAIFIYSCIARKTLMGKELGHEFKILESLGTTSGFFTYGEYFHSKNMNEVLNVTTTFLTLSESKNVERENYEFFEHKADNRIIKALSQLSKVTTEELESKNKELARLNDMISRTVLYTTSDLEGNITSVSKAMEEFTNSSAEELLGKNHNIFRHEDTPDELYDEMWRTIETNNKFVGEFKNKRQDGSVYWIRASIEPLFNDQGEKVAYSAYREDITDKKRLEYLSSHDPLTTLYNRGEFDRSLNIHIKSAQRYNEKFCFIIMDIDHFKSVNDLYGHHVGDEVLVKFAKCLSENTREDDFIARWGGEEFVVLTKTINIENIKMYIEKLQAKIAESSFSPAPKITASFGITLYRKEDNKDSILKRVDEALYLAKENGRDRYEIV